MPIRAELRPLYPADWSELSRKVRFERAGGCCQTCRRPHGLTLRCLPDGRWFDPQSGTWRNGRGRGAAWPDLVEAIRFRETRVVLAAAHLDHDPANNRLRNLRSMCQRCHLMHDRPYHLAQRRLTYRRRYAIGDLFLGPYGDVNALTYSGYQIADLQTGGLVAGSGNASRGYALDLDDVEAWIRDARTPATTSS